MELHLWLPILQPLFSLIINNSYCSQSFYCFCFWRPRSCAKGSWLWNIHLMSETNSILSGTPWDTMVLRVLAPAQAQTHWNRVWVVSLCLRIEPWAHHCEELSGGVSCPQKSLETEAVSYKCSANRYSLVKQSCNTI